MTELLKVAEGALARLKTAGFDQAQVTASISSQDELNIAHNDASLLRSTEDYKLGLIGIVDGRKATMSLTDFSDDAVAHTVSQMFERAQDAPQDDANKVSSSQTGNFVQGPQQPDPEILARKVSEMLEFRAAKTPRMNIEEGAAAYHLGREHVLTSEGTSIASSIGCYALMVFGTASEDGECSSFNDAHGYAYDLSTAHASDFFRIGEMFKETERQIKTQSIGGNFVGDVVLAPGAVSDLVSWLLSQLGDSTLIADSSVYKKKVGEMIASPMLTMRSRFDGPGLAPYTNDAFVAKPIEVISEGRLGMLLPTLYGSIKTGIAHTPATSGWQIETGKTSREAMIGDIKRGALVSRLSMGQPAVNGDFSGVIKNSFLINGGEVGPAVSETMIAGNIAQMLKDISAISVEHLDTGSSDYPWIRIRNLHFS